eukprot:scaffold120905_cov15-Tisochrysis_lutea.AAC.1
MEGEGTEGNGREGLHSCPSSQASDFHEQQWRSCISIGSLLQGGGVLKTAILHRTHKRSILLVLKGFAVPAICRTKMDVACDFHSDTGSSAINQMLFSRPKVQLYQFSIPGYKVHPN